MISPSRSPSKAIVSIWLEMAPLPFGAHRPLPRRIDGIKSATLSASIMNWSSAISPITEISEQLFRDRGITLSIKREELVGGPCQGNKLRKLKYHLSQAMADNKEGLLTLGGAFSNHLYAVAYAGYRAGLPTTGLLRGEYDAGNPTLIDVQRWGMQLIPTPRSVYRHYRTPAGLIELEQQYPGYHLVPEGGTHAVALRGVGELVEEVRAQSDLDYDYWCVPFATGGTALGIAQKLRPGEQVLAAVVLKGLDPEQICAHILPEEMRIASRLRWTQASFGGFARRHPAVEQFVQGFYDRHAIYLDPIYMGKIMCRLYQMIAAGEIRSGRRILVVHTGGLQGTRGYNYRFGTNLPVPSRRM